MGLNSFNVEELEYQLFNLEARKEFFESDSSKLVCNVWNYLFEKHDRGEIDLLLPVESHQFQDFLGEK